MTQKTVELLTALAEPTRLLALRLLWDGNEHCVCELMRALDATQSRASRHLSVLKKAGLVTDQRDAQRILYRRNPKLETDVIALVQAALDLEGKKKRKGKTT